MSPVGTDCVQPANPGGQFRRECLLEDVSFLPHGAALVQPAVATLEVGRQSLVRVWLVSFLGQMEELAPAL